MSCCQYPPLFLKLLTGHEEYPNRFDIDTTSQLLGTVKPYGRQLLISTGQSDWDREVTHTSGSLAAYLVAAQRVTKSSSPSSSPRLDGQSFSTKGIFGASESRKVSVLNASHHSTSTDETVETVLVLPDYKLVTDVRRSPDGAQELWDTIQTSTADQRPNDSALKSWVLPYSCVILLCMCPWVP
jgi:hypothetical protein